MKKQVFTLSILLIFSGSFCAAYYEGTQANGAAEHGHSPEEGDRDRQGAVAVTDSAPGSRSTWYKDSDARRAYLRGGSDYQRDLNQDYRYQDYRNQDYQNQGYQNQGYQNQNRYENNYPGISGYRDDNFQRSNSRWYKDSDARKAHLRGEGDYHRLNNPK